MYIEATTILQVASIVSALGALGTILYKSFRWMEKQNQQEIEIENIKKEQCVMCYAILAALDGLMQLGANGNVTEAHQKLEKHLNKTAHE